MLHIIYLIDPKMWGLVVVVAAAAAFVPSTFFLDPFFSHSTQDLVGLWSCDPTKKERKEQEGKISSLLMFLFS